MARWWLLFLLIPWQALGQTPFPSDSLPLLLRTIAPEAAQADLRNLEQWLLATHPAALTDDSLLIKGAINRAVNATKMPQSNWMFARTVAEAMATLGDSHTGLNWRVLTEEIEETWGRFPEAVQLEAGQIQLPSTGEAIDSIGGWTARAALENARNMCSSEGFARPAHYRHAARIWPWVAAVPLSPNDAPTAWTDSLRAIPLKKPGAPVLRDEHSFGIASRFDGSLAVLQVSTFGGGKPALYYRHVRRFFRKVNRRRLDGIVLDLRSNTGGLSERMEGLARYLIIEPTVLFERLDFRQSPHAIAAFPPDFAEASPAQRSRWARSSRWAAWRMEVDTVPAGELWSGTLRPLVPARRAFHGKVAVLVDGGTASTAAHLATWAATQARMVTVGEPALSSPLGTYAHAADWSLPQSGLPVQCATMRVWVMDGEQWNEGQWMPEVISPHGTAEDAARQWLGTP